MKSILLHCLDKSTGHKMYVLCFPTTSMQKVFCHDSELVTSYISDVGRNICSSSCIASVSVCMVNLYTKLYEIHFY
jgi:hypothetical protein